MVKQYKPGQFVNIHSRLCRVVKSDIIGACTNCISENGLSRPCNGSFSGHSECIDKLGCDMYPKLMQQCGNQGS